MYCSIPLYSFHRQWICSISFSLESFLPSDFRSFLVFLLSPLTFHSFLYLSPSSMSFCSPWISLPKTICLIDMLNNILMSFNVSLCIRFKNKTIFKNFIIKKKYFQLVWIYLKFISTHDIQSNRTYFSGLWEPVLLFNKSITASSVRSSKQSARISAW